MPEQGYTFIDSWNQPQEPRPPWEAPPITLTIEHKSNIIKFMYIYEHKIIVERYNRRRAHFVITQPTLKRIDRFKRENRNITIEEKENHTLIIYKKESEQDA